MEPAWHINATGRNKIIKNVNKYPIEVREEIEDTLKMVEKYPYQKLLKEGTLKQIKQHKKAREINLHEVVITYRRIQVRIFSSVKSEYILHLFIADKNSKALVYNHAIITSYNNYQSIHYGNDTSQEKSIRQYDLKTM